jgi:hypothetical protein
MERRFRLRPLAGLLACMAFAPAKTIAQTTPAPVAETTLPEVKVRDTTPGPDYNPPESTIGGASPRRSATFRSL